MKCLLALLVVLAGTSMVAFAESGSSLTGETSPETADAFTKLRTRALSGDAEAQLSLGSIYALGARCVAKDSGEAVTWWLKAAKQGNLYAQVRLANSLLTGFGVTEDHASAAKWYREAAEKGNTWAQDRLGRMYESGDGVREDHSEAAKWYRMAAEQGSLHAESELGFMFTYGDGVPLNIAEGIKWYRMAADHGDIGTQTVLGTMYNTGFCVPKSSIEAAKWFSKAAFQGYALAQCYLGVEYATGDGVAKNEIEGLAWMNIAAASGQLGRATQLRDSMEISLGRDATLVAQQRSKELVAEIETHEAQSSSGENTPLNSSGQTDMPKSSGSGVIISVEGLLLTAAHVVAGAARIEVVTVTGTRSAAVLRVDDSNDIAVLKIEGGPYVPIPIASSRYVRVGQAVATIGFPNLQIQGFGPKVTRGEISSLNGAGDDPREWQVSVPVQPGNSGGPLLDEDGNMVGLIESKLGLAATQAIGDIPQNVNYALKSAYALALLEPYLGSSAPEPHPANPNQKFEDLVANAQRSVVLILCY